MSRTDTMRLLKEVSGDLVMAAEHDRDDVDRALILRAAEVKAQMATAYALNRIADELGRHLPRLK